MIVALTVAAVVCLAALLYTTGGAPFGPTVSFDGLSSRYAMLIDADSGEVIQSRDADARMYPASLTKVMTAVVVLDQADALDAVVEAPADMFPTVCGRRRRGVRRADEPDRRRARHVRHAFHEPDRTA